MLDSKIKVLLSTIPIALLGTLMVLVVQTMALPAMAQPAQETFFESAVREANQTGTSTGAAAAINRRSMQLAKVNHRIEQQGEVEEEQRQQSVRQCYDRDRYRHRLATFQEEKIHSQPLSYHLGMTMLCYQVY